MRGKLTPLMRQYREIKDRYRSGILLFQVGDFYETFYEDAEDVSKILNIALTTRDKGKKSPVPLAGVPVHAAGAYIAKLLQAGRKVVVCDQAEVPTEAKGIVKRRVTDVITPGTTLAPSTLQEKENNYIISLAAAGEFAGFSLLDFSTGEFTAGEGDLPSVENMISGYNVREALVQEDAPALTRMVSNLYTSCTIEELEEYRFSEKAARERLLEHFRVDSLDCFGLEERELATVTAGALLDRVKELRQNDLNHITGLRLVVPRETMFLDRETLRNLEIFEPLRGESPETTLIHHMDRTETAMGARELRKWLMHPSRNISVVRKRQDGIEFFRSDILDLREMRMRLRRFPDIERLTSRITAGKANPRELLSLASALERVPGIGGTVQGSNAELVAEAVADLITPTGVEDLIERGIEPASPSNLRDGGVIREGFSEQLDRLIEGSREGRKWIASLQESERLRTGIGSLKVGYNKVFGYYIEVSRIHDSKIPDDYLCKQTLVSSQRYVTKELKEREQSILSAEARRIELERETFNDICNRISKESGGLQRIARAVAILDILSSLAEIALERGYCRPEMDDSANLTIVEGRHPVVEIISEKSFIPNDLELRPEEKQVLIITGPNMGGKSTYIRQAALISILAQAGSYVPASRAEVGLMDRIFTRVGSSDNLARGQSTFLVEMGETAKILHNCTSRSLVLLDEIGRGTSTLDGLSIAWSVTEFLLENSERKPKTLFATHYHELTHLCERYPRVMNMKVAVKEWGDTILFLYKIQPGAGDKSYGIHVAKLAGLPPRVIERAWEILGSLEEEGASFSGVESSKSKQMALFHMEDSLRELINRLNINNITPLEALRILADLHRKAKER